MLNNAKGLPGPPSVWVTAYSVVQMGDQLSSLARNIILNIILLEVGPPVGNFPVLFDSAGLSDTLYVKPI